MLGFKTTDGSSLEKSSAKTITVVKDSAGVIVTNQTIEHYHAAEEKTKSPSKQVLTVEEFIKEYEKSKLSTPLSNKFFGRENELKGIITSLLDNNTITIVTGSGGVGKTRLCREVMTRFESQYPDFTTVCLVNKLDSIYSDLRLIFDSHKNYLIFIDDANRQNQHLMQLLAVMREQHSGQILLLITVRDYAVNLVKTTCADYSINTIDIKKMSDEDITIILGSPDFGITNPVYCKKILGIADGNPRLAIMAARVALEKKNVEILNNVSDVFELYFSTYLKDHRELDDPNMRKTMGLIGFFYVIDLDNEDFHKPLLERFGISSYTFKQNIELLERLELVGFSEDKNAVRITEQNLGNYFFFCCFIKDNLLSFETLLTHYFNSHYKRFTEGVVSANNHFGAEVVEAKLTPILRNHFHSIQQEKAALKIKFLEVFWFYLSDETLAYIDSELESIKAPESPHFETNPKDNYFRLNDSDSFLELIRIFLLYPFETNFEIAVELGFKNVSKDPALMPEWLKLLTEVVSFDYTDEQNDFFRQTKLFDIILQNAQEGKLEYIAAFYPLSIHFLKTESRVVKSERNYKISFYQYPIPFSEPIKVFRAKIWQFLLAHYEANSEKSYSLISEYCSYSSKNHKEFASFDLAYTLSLINQRLNPDNVNHCLLVNKYCHKLSRFEEINNADLMALKTKFKNQKLEWLTILDKNKYRQKNWYDTEFGDDYNKMLEAKEDEIRSYFDFNSLAEFEHFYQIYLELVNTNNSINRDLAWSLDIILAKHWQKDENLGFAFLSFLISENKVNGFIPYRIFGAAFLDLEQATKLHRFINKYSFKEKDNWLLRFFNTIPQTIVNTEFYDGFIEMLENLFSPSEFHWETIYKFISIDPNIYSKWLKIVSAKQENGCNIYLWHHFFEPAISYFSDEDLPILKKVYFQQIAMRDHFDIGYKDFLAILKRDNTFLEDFIRFEHQDSRGFKQANDHTKLGIIWELENAEELVEHAIILSRSLVTPFMSPFEFYANVFFYSIKSEQSERIKQFSLDFIAKYQTEKKLIQVIINIVKTSFNDFYEIAFKHYLSLNQALEDFKEIRWEESTGGIIRGGRTSFGEMTAHELNKILKWVENMPTPSKYIHHKAYLKERISHEEAYALIERRRNFSNDDF